MLRNEHFADKQRHVLVRLQGGLGNQLFQIAAGTTVSRKLDASLSFTKSSDTEVLTDLLDSPIHFAPSSLEIRSGLRPSLQPSMRAYWAVSRRLLPKRAVLLRQAGNEAYNEASNIDILKRSTYIGMDGYFQHPSYYEGEKDQILHALNRQLLAATNLVQPSDFAVIAMRRGDYVRNGWALTESYYRRAISAIELNREKVYVIADDPMMVTVVAGWLKRPDDDVRPPKVELKDEVRDLALLAGARQVIMANSTFHWWGVVAGDAEHERRVIAPARWIAHIERSRALLQPNWELIPD